MKKLLVIPVLASACIEYTPTSTSPAVVTPNARPVADDTKTDRLVQVVTPEVDILWIIDNSCSMAEEQSGVSTHSSIFLDYFLGSGLEYHIGVVSTDNNNSKNGRLIEANGLRWIEPDTPNALPTFRQMIELGTSGAFPERGLDASYRAIEVFGEPGGPNEGFIREDASLHMLAISDEYDHSKNITPTEYINWFDSIRDEDSRSFSAIVPMGNCPNGWGSGVHYSVVTDAVGGVKWNVCNDDWSTVLEQVGLQANGSNLEYFLSELPVDDTIAVRVEDGGMTFTMTRDLDYSYSQTRNSISFLEYVPRPLAEVFIDYTTLASKGG